MMEVRCSDCKNTFCLQHRHPVDHGCSELLRKSKNPGRGATRGATSMPAAGKGGQTGLTPKPEVWSSAKGIPTVCLKPLNVVLHVHTAKIDDLCYYCCINLL